MQQGRGRLDDAQFGRLLTDIRSTTEVDAAFGGLLTPRRNGFAITHTRGARTGELRNLAIHSGLGLGGKSISLRRPVWVRDYPVARGITHDYDSAVRAERLRAIFAVPLTLAGGEVRAVIYGALRQDVPLGDRTLRAAELAIRRCARELAADAENAESPPSEEPGEPIRDLRTARDELAALAADVDDDAIKRQLNDICDRMRATRQDRAGPRGDRAGAREQRAGARLSPRELAVLAQVAEGCRNREVAERLGILPGTVKAYLESAMRKLGTDNRMRTVNAARTAGLLP